MDPAPLRHLAAIVVLLLVGTAAQARQDPGPEAKAALRQALSWLVHLKPADPAEGVEPMERAAALGDRSAKFHLAYLYWYSRTWRDPVDEAQRLADQRKARALFLDVAETGDPYAAAALGTFFQEGIGGNKDLAKARTWYEVAAKGGLANPAWRLGRMSEHGIGARFDLVEAYKWFDIGTRLYPIDPDDPAQMADRRDEIARRMTAKQIAAAQARSRAWQASVRPYDACYAQEERIRLDVAVDDVGLERDFGSWIADVERQLKRRLRRPPCSALEGRTRLTVTVRADGKVQNVANEATWGLPYFDAAVATAMKAIEPAPLPPHERGRIGVKLLVGAYYNEHPLPTTGR